MRKFLCFLRRRISHPRSLLCLEARVSQRKEGRGKKSGKFGLSCRVSLASLSPPPPPPEVSSSTLQLCLRRHRPRPFLPSSSRLFQRLISPSEYSPNYCTFQHCRSYFFQRATFMSAVPNVNIQWIVDCFSGRFSRLRPTLQRVLPFLLPLLPRGL